MNRNHLWPTVCLVTALMTLLIAGVHAAPFPIASDGRMAPGLYLAPTLPAETATDLCRVLQAITGGNITVATALPAGPAIVVGDKSFEAFGGRYNSLQGRDTFQIAVAGNQLHLVGATQEATGHAVYSFLQDLGCRWYIPGPAGEVLPRNPDLAWTGEPRVESPSFYLRELWWAYGAPPRPRAILVNGNAATASGAAVSRMATT